MMRVPAAIGVCALILLGSALSACANGGNKGGPPATSNAVCQPGVCLGSTGLASLPWGVQRLH
jgi:hypothetical protein